jgi:hypothetical protein
MLKAGLGSNLLASYSENSLIVTPIPVDIISAVISSQEISFCDSAPLPLRGRGDIHT